MFKYRFIHRIKSDDYLIQRKNWLGQWRYVRFIDDIRAELPVGILVSDKDKGKLLKRVLVAYNIGINTTLLEYPLLIMKRQG
jgi:hypothetical protein